jgi:putative SOS response-associated peptidase YedK
MTMCGRFALFSDINVIKNYAQLFDNNLNWSAHYNIAPSLEIPVIINSHGKRYLTMLKWGFVPDFARHGDNSGFNIINAKAETLAIKPSFKQVYKKNRCLIPANGFYEWRKKDKQPFYVTVEGEPLLFLAGIWNKPVEKTQLGTFAIITTNANSTLEPIHHRMPLILTEENLNRWLFQEGKNSLEDVMEPYPDEGLKIYPVSREVNYSSVNHPGLVERVTL